MRLRLIPEPRKQIQHLPFYYSRNSKKRYDLEIKLDQIFVQSSTFKEPNLSIHF